MKRPTSEWLVHADVGHNDILQHNKHTKTQHPSRRSRGDMIETYKLLTGKYDQQVTLIITLPKNVTGEYFTRGSCNKLLVKRCRYEPWKNFLHSMVRWFLKLQMLRAIRWAWNPETGIRAMPRLQQAYRLGCRHTVWLIFRSPHSSMYLFGPKSV